MSKTNPIERLKKQAKALHCQVLAGEPAALARVDAVYRERPEPFGLMRAQHVIATEYGFPSWNDLMKTPVNEVRAAIDARKATQKSPVKAVTPESVEAQRGPVNDAENAMQAFGTGTGRGAALQFLSDLVRESEHEYSVNKSAANPIAVSNVASILAALHRKTVPEVVMSNGVDALVSDVAYTSDRTSRILSVRVTLRRGAEPEWSRRQYEVMAKLNWWAWDGWTVELVAA